VSGRRITVELPEELVERVAERAAELVLEQLERRETRRWLTVEEAAARASCSPAAMRKRIERGVVRACRQRGRVYVDVADLDGSFRRDGD
jgi:hypothetical protein